MHPDQPPTNPVPPRPNATRGGGAQASGTGRHSLDGLVRGSCSRCPAARKRPHLRRAPSRSSRGSNARGRETPPGHPGNLPEDPPPPGRDPRIAPAPQTPLAQPGAANPQDRHAAPPPVSGTPRAAPRLPRAPKPPPAPASTPSAIPPPQAQAPARRSPQSPARAAAAADRTPEATTPSSPHEDTTAARPVSDEPAPGPETRRTAGTTRAPGDGAAPRRTRTVGSPPPTHTGDRPDKP